MPPDEQSQYLADLYYVSAQMRSDQPHPWAGPFSATRFVQVESIFGIAAALFGFWIWSQPSGQLLAGVSWVVAVVCLWEPAWLIASYFAAIGYARKHPERYEVRGSKFRLRLEAMK